ncbi:MAG: hypothetical protein K2Y71_13055 [Xanthobacteraceae bacterium]|nr:hypothetical protein [Xanthobacteraceae bacterium]
MVMFVVAEITTSAFGKLPDAHVSMLHLFRSAKGHSRESVEFGFHTTQVIEFIKMVNPFTRDVTLPSQSAHTLKGG